MAQTDDAPEADAERWDEAVLGTPAAPWDQPEEPADHGVPVNLRPRQRAGGVHPGWASAPQQAYDDAASGGWGVPGQLSTGPMPKIRREPAGESEPRAGETAGETAGEAAGETAGDGEGPGAGR